MSVINITYKELLSVAIELPFYTDGRGRKGTPRPQPDISIAPDAETVELFRRMDLILREVPGGVLILARTLGETDEGAPVMRFPARKEDKITLLLRLNNPDVLAVNELPLLTDTKRLLYLSNTVADGDAARNNLHLSKSADGIRSDNDSVPFTKDIYRFDHSAAVNPAAAIVKHLLSGRETGPASCVNESPGAKLVFDLATMPGGICELRIDGALKDRFYHPAGGAQPPFAVAELSLDAALDEPYRIIEADRSLTPERPRYTVRFVSRETRWRYTFSLQPASPLALELTALGPAQRAVFLDKLNIVSNDSNVSFTAQASDTGDELIFLSDAAAPLRESYFSPTGAALSLALHKNIGDGAGEAVVRRGLPYPSTRIVTAAGSEVYSDIFITI